MSLGKASRAPEVKCRRERLSFERRAHYRNRLGGVKSGTARKSSREDAFHFGRYGVDLAEPVDGPQLALGVVIPDQRRGAAVIGHQPNLHRLAVVIGAARHFRRPAMIADPLLGRGARGVVVDFATFGADVAPDDAVAGVTVNSPSPSPALTD